MSKNVRLDIHNYVADDAISKYLLAKFGAADGAAALATAATDKLLGVNVDVPAAATERVDLVRLGSTPVIYGGTVTRGQYLTAGAGGKAVAVTLPGASASAEVIGKAEISGVLNDVGSVYVQPFVIYG
ncbi:MAG: DUF2190 domain-containing protein [Panacagrimonas sp.]